jgi:hypothetical protein
MDPWHIHPPPLDHTDMDGWGRTRGEMIPQISDMAWAPRGRALPGHLVLLLSCHVHITMSSDLSIFVIFLACK